MTPGPARESRRPIPATVTCLRRSLLPVLAGIMVLAVTASACIAAKIETRAPNALLMHAESGAILYEKNADELIAPASLSKLMTMVLVFEALKRGEVSLSDEFFVSEKAWRRGGSRMFVRVGTSVPLEDLIQGVIVQSGNDACIVLAEGLSGTEDAFAEEMNARAEELGLIKSHFTNSTGWPDPEHRTTARELAMIARHIVTEFKEYYHYYSQQEYTWNDIKQRNRNPLLGKVKGVDGLKTGYTEESGYGLVVSAEREGQRLILVVTGLKSRRERAEEARKLLEWGFRAFHPYTLFDKGTVVGDVAVWGGEEAYVPVAARDAVTLMMTRPARRKVTAEVVYTGPVAAPISEGDEIATLRIKSIEDFEVKVPLYARKDVPRGGLLRRAINAVTFMVLGG